MKLCAALALALVFQATAAEPAAVPVKGFRAIDLTRFAAPEGSQTLRSVSVVAQGERGVNGVPFRVYEPVAVTGMDAAREGEFFPTAVKGIPIGSKARRIHLLHGLVSDDVDGVPFAKVVWRYAGGGTESTRLGYGVHARASVPQSLERRKELFDPNSRLAWPAGEAASGGRIYQTALENPRPDEAVASIDYVSLFSRAAPFVLALSVEDAGSGLPANAAVPSRKPVREMMEFSDGAYRREFVVRVTDGNGGRPLSNAVASLAITDDKQTFFFGESTADAEGVCRVPFPPQQTISYTLWVQARDRVPALIAESKMNGTKFTLEHAVALARGTQIGGLVKQANGEPVAGASVIIHRVTNNNARLYTRIDYDRAVTGIDGRWSSSSLPPDLSGLSLEVMHPDFRPASFATAGFAAAPAAATAVESLSPGTVRVIEDGVVVTRTTTRRTGLTRAPAVQMLTTNALASGVAEMTLQPAPLLEGTIVDANSKPVPGADVMVQRPDATGRKSLRSDGKGAFRTRMAEAGSAGIIVTREGFAPVYRGISVTPNTNVIQIELPPARVLRGRVVDQNQRPVPGAKVRLTDWQGTGDLLRFQAVADDDGRFTWAGAPLDQVVFQVSKQNYSSMRQSLSVGGEEVVIQLRRFPGVYGRVYDAESKKPIDLFTVVPGRKYSPNETQIRWERYEAQRGRDGEYALRMDSYMFQPEARVLIEAPGYEPQVSQPFRGQDSYTNDFALKKGRGISGVVLLPNGSPAAGAALVLAERGESASLEQGGQVRGSGSSADVVRSDAQGRFEFTPKLEPDRIFASHEQGFAELKAETPDASHRLTLQKWGTLKGAMRVGDGSEGMVRLQNRYDRYSDSTSRPATLSMYWKADCDTNGMFLFEKVPPGEHRLAVEYRFKENNYGETPLSHGFNVIVKAGGTTEATLGGNGRRVVGRVKLLGGDHADIDWKRDVHRLHLVLSNPIAPPVFAAGLSPQEQQQAWADYNTRQREFWQSEAGRAQERAERSYVLLFDTNGNFHADHVPPGKYNLALNVTDPEEEYYNRRTIGTANKEVIVPDERNAKVNAPLGIGEIELAVRLRVKIGRVIPSFEGKMTDGKAFKLSDHRGKYVLLHFWGQSVGYSSYDVQTLRELQVGYPALVIIGCNMDPNSTQAETFAKNQRMNWPQVLLGDWSQTPVPGMFGIQGNTAAVLIDPAGKLASGTLRGTSLRNTVMNLLGRE